MAALSTIIAGAALGLGVASTASSVINAKKERKDQKAANLRQETQAKEAAALSKVRDGDSADVVFGTSKASDELLKRGSRRKTTSNKKVSSPIGGL